MRFILVKSSWREGGMGGDMLRVTARILLGVCVLAGALLALALAVRWH